MSGKIKLDEFITHKMSLEQVNDAINLMKTGGWYIFHSHLSVSEPEVNIGKNICINIVLTFVFYLTAFDPS